MKIIVNDANLLIDLVELNILADFFGLEVEFHTTEIILDELADEQKERLFHYIEKERLIVDTLTEGDLIEIFLIRASKPNLSEQDCSAFCKARNDHAAILTSDNFLRKFAKSYNIEVYGHLWIFDSLVDREIMTGISAAEKLNQLCRVVNPKLGLPFAECRTILFRKVWF